MLVVCLIMVSIISFMAKKGAVDGVEAAPIP